MSQPSVLIFLEEKPMAGRTVPVTPGHVIGRDACDVVLPDPEVSRRHAIVRALGEHPAIQDLGSLNGTFVNGRRIEGVTPLHVGDVLRLGNTVWHVRPADGDGG